MAKTLEEGERFRFQPGATSVLFVNLRERNSVDSEMQLVRAKADYQKALAPLSMVNQLLGAKPAFRHAGQLSGRRELPK